MNVKIRAEKKEDYEKITEINTLAFHQPNEGKMVEALRKNPRFLPELSLVAFSDNEIIGHVLFFPVDIKTASERITVLSLAPIAVHPTYQKQGVGKKLIHTGIAKARQLPFPAIIVLGHPSYYPCFGFVRASTWGIILPFEAPDEASMVLVLHPSSLEQRKGMVEYPAEYYSAL
jgi:putative acetyltransferase